MITLILALAARFNRPSTDKAIKGITKALDHLDAVVAAENDKIDRLDDKITKVAKDRLDAFDRRDRASKIAAKFTDLVSV